MTIWSAGRYDAVGDRIAPIAEQVVDATARRRPLRDAAVVDLACGTGSAALAAAGQGAKVTGVDYTAELLTIAEQRPGADAVTWRVGDASDTGLPAAAFDAVVSNMGIIFVDPAAQVREITRLLAPTGVLAFSAWTRDTSNPLFDPVVAVLGPPAASGFSPDQWGDADTLTDRLAPHFDDIDIRRGRHSWEFASMAAALHFLRAESPVHVETFRRASDGQRDELAAAFETALGPHVDGTGAVTFGAPYVVVSARYRAS
ncbi:SAM-dependent methyltransferase [Mycolicibacterium duvalii]|uniref:SAM-dependent methyltransferase n=1 Tax=Mycolicibacterium duvalii TaxID=39688 RepID=A0A7I7K1G8_9MYCO|nr:class I SAM-dependent methyltransferase [Mycolicibacterium duvalii]MCV7367480.1 class I SAM-dependent methyltransferase [Mycolicibacterium duvalii]PEG39207.1 SAM-dependent methyltransferase [Mycolicibacterium duvalii]BBX17905.1 SAM-dependent methyltransferase [Mycolicibacterium duvalii]